MDSFDQQMGLLTDCFRVIPLADAVRGLRSGGLPSRAACVTFDDGYADNAEIALPIAAGSLLYVAATDLMPEVNRDPGVRMAFVVFAGMALFLLVQIIAPSL